MNNKIVLITGASKGIGLAVAKKFAASGSTVILTSSNATRLKNCNNEIENAGGRASYHPCDLRKLKGCESLADFIKTETQKLDILVHCAGATQSGPFLEQNDETWMDGFALKFHGAVRTTRILWPYLVKSQGSLINIIGGAARTPNHNFLIGGAVNAALSSFTKGLSNLGKIDGVQVNAIHPGLTKTERMETLLEQRAVFEGISIKTALNKALEGDGIRRPGTPEEVAALTIFLCSEEARHIQGTAIAIDGGATPGLY